MSNVLLKSGQVYEMGMLGGAAIVLNSTDHVHDTRFCRNNMEITGTLSTTQNISALSVFAGTAVVDHDVSITDSGRVFIAARDNSYGQYIQMCNSSTGYTTTDGILFGFDGSEQGRIHGYSDVDILNIYLNNSHLFQYQNDGDFHALGDVIAYSSTPSDIRLKTNIRPITSSLSSICKLNGVKFDWIYKKDPEYSDQLGLIAQEVEKVVPEVVQEKHLPFYASSSTWIDEDGMENTKTCDELYKVVNYEQLVPHLIESIKELKSEIDELKIKLENK